jgi:hypothetical protein
MKCKIKRSDGARGETHNQLRQHEARLMNAFGEIALAAMPQQGVHPIIKPQKITQGRSPAKTAEKTNAPFLRSTVAGAP